ncbi:SGNH hydrolase [Fusarium mexicanum]|uniref:SGNH hydrolase n=1 Tax=Fusarium mexicanum TaxID=751941 RepID=A0A8H5I9T8_9HYPO|nr:SGNH hydrolase [Fusarium mexicanum]
MGAVASGGGAKGYQVRFADLNGDGRAEFIWVKDSGSASVWWNRGFNHEGSTKVVWGPASGEKIATGIGDGQADFIHLSEEGAATLYINQGRRDTGNWGWWECGVVATGVGSKRENIHFADMSGDGRDDYMAVDETTGGLSVWYKRGTESGNWGAVSPIVWWNPGAPIASGVDYLPNWSTSDIVTFVDLNGDGRAEYIFVGVNDSSIYAFLNGC